MLEMVMMVLMFLGGGGTDLAGTVDTEAYWKAKGVTVSVEQLLHDAKPGVAGDVGKQVAEQITNLGAVDYAKRAAAKQALLAIGMPALEQLKGATTNKDPEVAASAKELIAKLGRVGKAVEIRQLMAIRTLGEKKAKEGSAVLTELSTTTTPFVADYAKRALGQIEGKEVVAASMDRKALAEDVWLMPSGLGFVAQQTAGLGKGMTLGKLIDQAASLEEGPEGAEEKAKMKERATKSVIELMEKVGNVRIDSVTLGVGGVMDDDHGFAVLTVRGKWDKKAVAQGLRDMFEGEGDVGEPMPGGPGMVPGAPGVMPIMPPGGPAMPMNVPGGGPQGNAGGGAIVTAVAVAGPGQVVQVHAGQAGPGVVLAQAGPVGAGQVQTQVAPAPTVGPMPNHIVVGGPIQGMPAQPPVMINGGPMTAVPPPPPDVVVGGKTADDMREAAKREPLDMRGPVELKGPDDTAIVVSDEQMVFIAGEDDDRAKVSAKMMEAIKTGKGGVTDDKEMATALKGADASLPVWGVMQVTETYAKGADFLARFKMIAFTGTMKGMGLELTATATAKDKAGAEEGAKGLSGMFGDAIKDITSPDNHGNLPELDAMDKAMLALLKKIEVKADGTSTVVTTTLSPAEATTILRMLPMGDLVDMLTAPSEDETPGIGNGVMPVPTGNGPGVMVDPFAAPVPQPMPAMPPGPK